MVYEQVIGAVNEYLLPFQVFNVLRQSGFRMLTKCNFLFQVVLNDIPSLNNPSAIFMLCTLLVLYSPSAILFNTCLSYIFDKMDSAQSIMPNITTWVGVIPFILVAVLDTFKWGEFLSLLTLVLYYQRSN